MSTRRLWGVFLVLFGCVLLWLAAISFLAGAVASDPVARFLLFIFTVGLVPFPPTPSEASNHWGAGFFILAFVSTAAGILVYRSARSVETLEAYQADFERVVEANRASERRTWQFWRYNWAANFTLAIVAFVLAMAIDKEMPAEIVGLVGLLSIIYACTAVVKLCANAYERISKK
jgi:hypothetical protein